MQFAQRLLSSRGGTIALAGLAAVLAASVFLLYLNRYRSSVSESAQPTVALVAESLITKGTPGSVIASKELFRPVETAKGDLKDGAITDPATIRGRVATEDIYPGQQLTVSDFSATTTDALSTRIADDQRAISVPLDSAHGMIGDVQPGDHVDVLAGFNIQRIDRNGAPVGQGQARPVLKVIMQDVLVLGTAHEDGAAVGNGANTTSNVTLRVTNREAANLAFSSDNGKVWIVLRPGAGAPAVEANIVTLETLLLGLKPITILKSFGGRQ